MTDLSQTIAPKSDQLNADDLIAGPRTVRIVRVAANPDSAEQPISVFFEGDGGKPYRPCKSMRRMLVHVWGKDGNTFAGRSMTLYRDDKVQFGGLAVGGIRISHLSHITEAVTLALTATRANRKPFTVRPLALAGASAGAAKLSGREILRRNLALATSAADVLRIGDTAPVKAALAKGPESVRTEIHAMLAEAYARFQERVGDEADMGGMEV